MKKEKVEECVQLTSKVLTNYFQDDSLLLEQHLHSNCVWIGLSTSSYYQGKQEIVEVLKKERYKKQKIKLRTQEFNCILQDRKSCTVIGRYIVSTTLSGEGIFEDVQRVTFTWVLEEKQVSIIQMHMSNPLTLAGEGGNFPHNVGRHTKKYLDMLIQVEINRKGIITIKDTDNVHHQIYISHITYLEAFNTNTLIHTTKGDIFGRVQLIDIERKIQSLQENMFIRVHKSFCVNMYYIESMKRYEIVVEKKHRVPVSKNKYQMIREVLHA